MTEAARKPQSARSTKARQVAHSAIAQSDMGSFPKPTELSEQLAADNIRLAQKYASLKARITKMPYEDLFQVALVGLLKACRKYNHNAINEKTGAPYKLSTIAVPFIEGALNQYLRDRGHSSGVKFPDRWRDKASQVRKLASLGKSADAISEIVKLPAAEIEEILEAQKATAVLDPEIKLYSNNVEDLEEDHYELQQALIIADQAYNAISAADQKMLIIAWEAQRRRMIPDGPFIQFMRRARQVLDGAPIVREDQLAMEIYVANTEATDSGKTMDTKRKVVDPIDMIKAIESQLTLF